MRVFVDTSALYAILDEDDLNHDVAAATFQNLVRHVELVTHNYVHLEAEELVRRRLGQAAAATLVERLLPSMTTVWIDERLHAAALEAWRASGRRVSLVDQASFVVMRNLSIERAFAFDRDFDAAGFPAPDPPSDRPGRLSERPADHGGAPASDDVVGVAEIAARSGRSVSTVQSWRRRHLSFPPPLVELAAGPIWRWADVERWIAVRAHPARLTVPLFESGTSDLATRSNEYLAGFGER